MSAIDGGELEGYEALVSALRANPPVAPERLRQRVLEGAPVPRRRRSKKRRLALAVVPLVVVAAVGAAVVHGYRNSGASNASVPALAARTTGHVLGLNSGTATTPQAAGPSAFSAGKLVQHGSLDSQGHQSWNSAAQYQAAVPAAKSTERQFGYDALGGTPLAQSRALRGRVSPVNIPSNRLVHAVASLEVRVTSSDLSAKTNEASQIAAQFDGYAQSIHYDNSHQGGGSSVLELRVPVQKAEAALGKLASLGKVLSQQVSTQDLQQQLTHQTSEIGSLRRAIAVYETALRSTTISASDRATLQIRLNNARRQLSQAQHARRGTLASGATADISLLLVTRNSAVVTPQHHGSSRIGRLLGSAAHFLALEGIIVLYGLIVLAPVLLIVALVWWILRERRRREERLLSTA